MAKLPPVPIQQLMFNNTGLLSNVWADWFKHIFARVGGSVAKSNIELDERIDSLLNQLVPAGTILPFGGTVAPDGFLMCFGDQISRTTYAKLFSSIGTAYGAGDGSTTFHLPKGQGLFMRGADNGSGVDPSAASRTAMFPGGNTGGVVGSVQGAATALPSATPFSTDSQGAHSQHWTGVNNMVVVATSGGIPAFKANTGPNTLGAHTHSISGGDLETRPKNFNVNFIIKT